MALEIMVDCGETYRTAPEHIKRIYNQALFEMIYVIAGDGTCEVTPQFTGPYALIFGQEGQKQEPGQVTEPALVIIQWTSFLLQIRNDGTAAHILVGSGSSQRLLVENSGIEPLTS